MIQRFLDMAASSKRVIVVMAALLMLATASITIADWNMDSPTLKSIIRTLDAITVIALALTAVTAVPGFFLKNRLASLQDTENEHQRLEIASANQKASEAIAKAENSRLKQLEAETREKQVELELTQLRAKTIEVSDKAELAKVRSEKAERIVAPREVDAQRLSAKLKARRGTTFGLSAIADPEAQRLASTLETALVAAGWQMLEHTGASFTMTVGGPTVPPTEGVILTRANSDILDALESALQSEGVKTKTVISNEERVAVDIHVAAKPLRK